MKAKLYYKVLRDFGKGKASMLACRSSSLSCVMCPFEVFALDSASYNIFVHGICSVYSRADGKGNLIHFSVFLFLEMRN